MEDYFSCQKLDWGLERWLSHQVKHLPPKPKDQRLDLQNSHKAVHLVAGVRRPHHLYDTMGGGDRRLSQTGTCSCDNKRSHLKQGGRQGLALSRQGTSSSGRSQGRRAWTTTHCLDVTDLSFWNTEYLLCLKIWDGIARRSGAYKECREYRQL